MRDVCRIRVREGSLSGPSFGASQPLVPWVVEETAENADVVVDGSICSRPLKVLEIHFFRKVLRQTFRSTKQIHTR